ncbi:MAG: MarR family transcriptional regulator [Phycisphaerales bacterium]|nr:MarR family transcriptional regulator [Phycisphaerales bacterium]
MARRPRSTHDDPAANPANPSPQRASSPHAADLDAALRRDHPDRGGLADEIGKRAPFDLPEEEAFLNIVRTAAELEAAFHKLFKQHELSQSTYNVLRILRGSGALPGQRGRPTTEIGRDMVVHTPDVTRLIDRLIRLGLVERIACPEDRRVTHVRLTPAGEAKLRELDTPVRALNRSQLGSLSRADLAEISRLMAAARRAGGGLVAENRS